MHKQLLLAMALTVGLNNPIHSKDYNVSEIISNICKGGALICVGILTYKATTLKTADLLEIMSKRDEKMKEILELQNELAKRTEQSLEKRELLVEKEKELFEQQRALFEKTEIVIRMKKEL